MPHKLEPTPPETPTPDFLPLPMAAAIAYLRVVEPEDREPSSSGLLDVVASALSLWVPIFGSRAPGMPRERLSDEEVRYGRFVNGASEMRFRDGRRAVEDLAIRHADLEVAIRRLKRAGVRFSDAIIDPAPRRIPRVLP